MGCGLQDVDLLGLQTTFATHPCYCLITGCAVDRSLPFKPHNLEPNDIAARVERFVGIVGGDLSPKSLPGIQVRRSPTRSLILSVGRHGSSNCIPICCRGADSPPITAGTRRTDCAKSPRRRSPCRGGVTHKKPIYFRRFSPIRKFLRDMQLVFITLNIDPHFSRKMVTLRPVLIIDKEANCAGSGGHSQPRCHGRGRSRVGEGDSRAPRY